MYVGYAPSLNQHLKRRWGTNDNLATLCCKSNALHSCTGTNHQLPSVCGRAVSSPMAVATTGRRGKWGCRRQTPGLWWLARLHPATTVCPSFLQHYVTTLKYWQSYKTSNVGETIKKAEVICLTHKISKILGAPNEWSKLYTIQLKVLSIFFCFSFLNPVWGLYDVPKTTRIKYHSKHLEQNLVFIRSHTNCSFYLLLTLA